MQRCNKNKPRCFKKMNMLLKKKDTKQAKEGPKHFSKAGQFILIYLKALY